MKAGAGQIAGGQAYLYGSTFILEGTNYVQTLHQSHPAIYVPRGRTLTIKGSGVLTADAILSYAAEICGGYGASCGNITILDTVDKVAATKGKDALYSIGAEKNGSCSTVMIGDNVGSISESPYTYPQP